MHFHKQRGAVSIVVAIFTMLVLTVLALSFSTMTADESRMSLAAADILRAEGIAEGGIERGVGLIRDDVTAAAQTGNPAADGFAGLFSLDGWSTAGSAGTQNPDNARFYTAANSSFALLNINNTVIVSSFEQVLNFLNTRIRKIEIGARMSTNINGPGQTITAVLDYTTNGSFASPGPTSSGPINVTNANSAPLISTVDITPDQAWTFATLNSANFQIRCRVTARVPANARLRLDYLFVRLTTEVDTSTEPWFAGLTNVPLGGGTISLIAMEDESAKAHLNYASFTFLRSVFLRLGFTQVRATQLANNIIAYRAVNFFNTVEELFQISSPPTSVEFTTIRPFVTVSTYANTAALDPAGTRAPININTATSTILLSLFVQLGFAPGDSTLLVNDILTKRSTTPFTCFYSSDPNVTTDFHDFITTLPVTNYLNLQEQRNVLNNADATSRKWPITSPGGGQTVTTEFCYDSNAFRIQSQGSFPAGSGTPAVREYVTFVDDNGLFKIPVFGGTVAPGGVGNVTPQVYFRQL